MVGGPQGQRRKRRGAAACGVALGDARDPSGESMDFRLPNLGEGIDAATVTAVLVKPGDAVSAGQNVVSVETDKAAVDVPAEAAGTVEAVLVKPGDKVPIGGPILKLKDGAPASREAKSPT